MRQRSRSFKAAVSLKLDPAFQDGVSKRWAGGVRKITGNGSKPSAADLRGWAQIKPLAANLRERREFMFLA
jgi:hypothetical protein